MKLPVIDFPKPRQRCTIVRAEDLISGEITPEDVTCKDGDHIEFPLLSEMRVVKLPRNINEPSEVDYLITVKRNGAWCWLLLDPATLVKLLSGQELTVKSI